MDPLLISFFLILSPLLYLISPLFSVLSLMSQNSPNSHPRNEKPHPPLITLTRPAITLFSILGCSEVTHLSLLSTDHPPLITLTKPTISKLYSHPKSPKPKYTKEITRPTSISLTHLTPHRSSLVNPNSGFKRVKIPHDLSLISPIKLFHPFLPINSSPTKLCC